MSRRKLGASEAQQGRFATLRRHTGGAVDKEKTMNRRTAHYILPATLAAIVGVALTTQHLADGSAVMHEHAAPTVAVDMLHANQINDPSLAAWKIVAWHPASFPQCLQHPGL